MHQYNVTVRETVDHVVENGAADSIEQARAAVEAANPGIEVTEESLTALVADLLHLGDEVSVDGGGYFVAKMATKRYGKDADALNLRRFTDIVREAVPSAGAMVLATTDQSDYGFDLYGLLAVDGSDIQVPEELHDPAWDCLKNVGWRGVVGEDKHGYATLSLTQ